MAFMSTLVFRASKNKHEIEFINQQNDPLTGIIYDEDAGGYILFCTEAEMIKLGKYWEGPNFDIEECISDAEKQLGEKIIRGKSKM
jgi:hypothetical protein